MKDLWMRVEMDKEDIMVIDCGYLTEQSAKDRADQIFNLGVSKCNLAFGPSTADRRIHIYIPKSKIKKVMEALPVSDKKTWYGATHSYLADKLPGTAQNIKEVSFSAT